MKQITFTFAVVASLLLSAFTTYTSVNWKIAKGYSIKFTSKDPKGVFTSLKGDIAFDAQNLATAKFNVTVDAATINTGNGMQNKHAKSDKWLDVAKYPTITFISSKISKTAGGYEALGTLKLHGVEKQITLPFTFSNNTFTGSFEVNRMGYGIGTDKGMSGHAEKVLKIDLSVPVTQ